MKREDIAELVPGLKGAVTWAFGDKVGKAFSEQGGDFLAEYLHLTPEAIRRMNNEQPFLFQPVVPLGSDGKVLGEREKLFNFWTIDTASTRPYSRFVVVDPFSGPAPFFWQMGNEKHGFNDKLTSRDFEGLQPGLQTYFKEELIQRQSKKIIELLKDGGKDSKGRNATDSFLAVTESSEKLVGYLRERGEDYTLAHFSADKKAADLYKSYESEATAFWGLRKKEVPILRSQADFYALAQQQLRLSDAPIKINEKMTVDQYVDQEIKKVMPAVKSGMKHVVSPFTDEERDTQLNNIEKEASPFIANQVHSRVAMRQFFERQHQPSAMNHGRPNGGFEPLSFHLPPPLLGPPPPLGGAKK